MTPAERKALLFLGFVGVLGAGVRLAGSEPATAASTLETRRALLHQIAAVDSVRAEKERRERGKGRKARSADTSALGAAARVPKHGRARSDSGTPPAQQRPTSPQPPSNRVSWLGAASPIAGPRSRTYATPGPSSIDVDVADAAALEALPGVGPALAARIVSERERNGPFGGLAGLDSRVRGIGPALAGRLAARVTFSGIPRPPTADPTPPSTSRWRGRADRRTSRERRSP